MYMATVDRPTPRSAEVIASTFNPALWDATRCWLTRFIVSAKCCSSRRTTSGQHSASTSQAGVIFPGCNQGACVGTGVGLGWLVAGLESIGGLVSQERRKEVVEWLMVHPADSSVELR